MALAGNLRTSPLDQASGRGRRHLAGSGAAQQGANHSMGVFMPRC